MAANSPEADATPGEPIGKALAHFQINGLAGFQQDNGYTFAPQVSWNPTVRLDPLFALRGNLGLSMFKNSNTTDRLFLVTEYSILGMFSVDDGYLEIGGGAQTWAGNGGTQLLASGNIAWPLPKNFVPFLERIFIGYSAFFTSPRVTHEVKLGVGVGF